MHGGAIWVESGGEGKGSRFSFLLPLKPGQPRDKGKAHSPETLSPGEVEPAGSFLNRLRSTVSFYKRHNRPFALCCFQADARLLRERGHDVRWAVENEIRRYDFGGKLGHGEICLILQETDRNRAKTVCDRFSGKLGNMLDGRDVPYTVAVFPEDGKSAEALLRKVEMGKVRD